MCREDNKNNNHTEDCCGKYLVKLNVSEEARGVHRNGVISTEGFSMLDRSRLVGVHGGAEG
jgi:hypothetical protein